MHSEPERAMPYADRPYERRLAESGRKIVSMDIDAGLVDEIDRLRGSGVRRGMTVDQLLRIALRSPEVAAMR